MFFWLKSVAYAYRAYKRHKVTRYVMCTYKRTSYNLVRDVSLHWNGGLSIVAFTYIVMKHLPFDVVRLSIFIFVHTTHYIIQI